MKRISLSIAALMMTATLYAEADFNTVQAMIGKGEYQTALYALQVIEKNHPGMAKVQYTIAQAQAGIGNLPAAKVALAKAQAIDPKLAFVPESQVKELTAIINEVRVIKKVEQSSHWFLYTVLALGAVGTVAYFLTRRKETSVSETKSEVRNEETPSSSYSSTTGYARTSTSNVGSSSNYNSQSVNRQYRDETPVTRGTVEVHHYHDNSSNSSNVGTAIAAGAVAGVATSVLTNAMLNESHHNHDSHEYNNPHRDYFSNSNYASSRNDSDSLSSLNAANRRETEEVSNTWNDNSSSSGISDTWKDDSSSSSVSNSWEDEESTRSSSWGSSSSDDSSSYSSSSDDSSSSSWE